MLAYRTALLTAALAVTAAAQTALAQRAQTSQDLVPEAQESTQADHSEGRLDHPNWLGPFVPTPANVVDAALELAGVGERDVVYDLGSGDGRIILAAAQRFGAKSVGIEWDEALCETTSAEARRLGLQDRVKVVQGDIFKQDVSAATVVTGYLLPKSWERLGPILKSQLKAGARVVSVNDPIPGWEPIKKRKIKGASGKRDWKLYVYRIPATFATSTGIHVTDVAARTEVSSIIRTKRGIRPDELLRVQRDERLEQALSMAVWKAGTVAFIYRATGEGKEITGPNTLRHHFSMHADTTHVIAVGVNNGKSYHLHGDYESMAEFNKLMTDLKMRVSHTMQAEAVAEFYRAVNPENNGSLDPIHRLLELKQRVERQCQTSAFDPHEAEFDTWWKRAMPLYADLSFEQEARPRRGSYLVEWIVLSHPYPGLCASDPLRVRLKVKKNGVIGKLTYSSLRSRDAKGRS
jgi:SAM-dependent methyltransferase